MEWQLPGTKQICLQVNDQGCASPVVCRDIVVQDAPNVTIDPQPAQCFVGNVFDFTLSGDPAQSYNWNFGDGASPATSANENPGIVTYNTPGTKTVTLTTSGSGCLAAPTQLQVEVVSEPSAEFQLSAPSACLNESVDFVYNGTVLGPTQSFVWDFGPGATPATSTLPNPPSVTYTSGGAKDVKLRVTYQGCISEKLVSIQVNAGPVVTAGSNKEFCEGTGGVVLDASVAGGTAPYYYTWDCNTGGSCGIDTVNSEDVLVNPNISFATEDVTYYFQAVDQNGCFSAVDSVTVTVEAKPRVSAGPDRSLCPADAPGVFLQGALTFGNPAPQPITWEWSPAAGLSDPNSANPFARPDTTTIYTLKATSVNGCSSETNTVDPLSTVTITVKPDPVVEAGVDTGICVGGSIQLGAFASGSGPDYDYVWSPALPGTINGAATATPTVFPNSTTTFTVVVTSNGCTGSDSVRVQVDTQPTAEAGDNRDICQTESLKLEGKADGDPNATIYNYSWSPGIGLSDSMIGQPDAAPMQTTTYYLTATTDAGCASRIDSVKIDVLPTPVVELVTSDAIICEGEEVKLTAQHSYTDGNPLATAYSWDPQGAITSTEFDSVIVVSPEQSTFVTVTATSFTGRCVASDQVLIEVNPAIRALVEADTNRICEGDRLELKGLGSLGAATYGWLPANIFDDATSPNPLASPMTSTNVQLVLSEGVCTDTASFELTVVPTPQADYFSSLTEGCGELTVQFQQNTPDAEAYIWDFGDGSPLSNEPNPMYTYAKAGNYIVSLTTVGSFGCATTVQSINVSVAALPAADFTANPDRETRVPLP
ncbi:MAG: PKD domain-containing protein, partial [Bacteroidota bacterium]